MCGSSRRRRSKRYGTYTPNPKVESMVFRAESSSEVICIECGNLNPSQSNFCIACGSRIQTCPVSFKQFHPGDEYAKCLNCGTYFHLDHLRDWLSQKEECPICKNPLQVSIGKFSSSSEVNDAPSKKKIDHTVY